MFLLLLFMFVFDMVGNEIIFFIFKYVFLFIFINIFFWNVYKFFVFFCCNKWNCLWIFKIIMENLDK